MSQPIYSADPLPQSWYFDWNPADNPNPAPIVEQCGTIPINWRRDPATGPEPKTPLYLYIFTSHKTSPLIVPFGDSKVNNFVVPFPAGTRFQICMFDSNNNTGGCQAIWSVYPSPNGSNCTEPTFPTPFSVSTKISQTGWPAQCSLIEFTDFQGTPPYTFTAAPSLRPPTVIDNIPTSGLQWRVPYDHGTPFFVSVRDSIGRLWSWGPMHAGDGEDAVTSCLDYKHSLAQSGPAVPVGALAGATIAALILGALVTFGVLHWWAKRRKQPKDDDIVQPRATEKALTVQTTPFEITQQQVQAQQERYYGRPMSMTSEPPTQPSLSYTAGSVEDRSSNNSPYLHHHAPMSRSSRASLSMSGITSPTDTSGGTRRFTVTNSEEGTSRKLPHPPGPSRLSTALTMDGIEKVMKYRDSLASATSDGTLKSNRTITPGADPNASQVFVIHQDAGRAPAHIIANEGAPTGDIPPSYVKDLVSPSNPPWSAGSVTHQQSRLPGAGPSASFFTPYQDGR
ncbi:hypothetical protein FRC02_003083 [Tulasnella sp. 418]|nr:hypothetical protein FRC02_003083 [Tulasnella sp. 418]